MSQEQLQRIKVIENAVEGWISVAEAAELLGLSTRQVKRLKRQGASTWLKVVLSEGKNREIRRMLARLGHKVLHLKRTAIGPVLLWLSCCGALKVAQCRRVTQSCGNCIPTISFLCSRSKPR